jgi:hypothetical protein
MCSLMDYKVKKDEVNTTKKNEVNTTSKNIDERWQSLSPLPDTTSPEDWDYATEVSDGEIEDIVK